MCGEGDSPLLFRRLHKRGQSPAVLAPRRPCMSGITTLCFAGSFAAALGLELARLGWRSRVRGALAIGFATAGLAAETLYLGYRAATVETLPLASAYDWYLLAAWTLAAVYLYLAVAHPATASGLFILPLALALVAAAQFASKEPFAQTHAGRIWGTVVEAVVGARGTVPFFSADCEKGDSPRLAIAKSRMAGTGQRQGDHYFSVDGRGGARLRHRAKPCQERIAVGRSDDLALDGPVRLAVGRGAV